MTAPMQDVEARCAQVYRRHLEEADEEARSQAYEFGRTALAEGLGVLDMALLVSRATARARIAGRALDEPRLEEFLLECYSPFEMAHRGAREANEALRRMDERREEQLRAIARELHDETGQLLATLHHALEGVRPHLAPGGQKPLERSFGLLRRMEDEIRRLAHELRPVILDDLGLMPALLFLAESVSERTGIEVTVEGTSGGRLPPPVETALYRVVQEALTNAARHARASGVAVEIERTGRAVTCRIHDDGTGFDPAATVSGERRRGIGLEGMRERVTHVGGALDIRSEPGAGTELSLRIPLEGPHEDTPADRG